MSKYLSCSLAALLLALGLGAHVLSADACEPAAVWNAGLARRVLEFRQGCSALILGEHSPLAEPDREWLVMQCRTWADRFDEYLREVEGDAAVLAVRDAMDKIAEDEIVQKLRDRARQRSAA